MAIWKQKIAAPVFLAKITGPCLATYRGPRGPSMVKATSRPARKSRTMVPRARIPPRELEPRAALYPSRLIHCAIISPSMFMLVITTIPRSRQYQVAGKIFPCQNVKMARVPELWIVPRCSDPVVVQRIVRPIRMMAQQPAEAASAILIRCLRLIRRLDSSFFWIEFKRNLSGLC